MNDEFIKNSDLELVGVKNDKAFIGFTSIHMDALKEVASIGSGNAVSSLSQMTNKKIQMNVPEVNLLEFKDVGSSIAPADEMIVGILVSTSGDINGMVMFLLSLESARNILNYIYETPINSEDGFSEMDISSLQEVGNILISSYISALGTLINKRIIPSVPVCAIDMAGAILSVPAIEFGKIADGALHIETLFNSGDVNQVKGYFLLVPDLKSFNTIMKSLGVM